MRTSLFGVAVFSLTERPQRIDWLPNIAGCFGCYLLLLLHIGSDSTSGSSKKHKFAYLHEVILPDGIRYMLGLTASLV